MTREGWVAGVKLLVGTPILRSQLSLFSYVVCRLGLVAPPMLYLSNNYSEPETQLAVRFQERRQVC